MTQVWSRAIALVDMNAFFAAVEQLDYPELCGKPVAITNGEQGSAIITSSYEARAFGIKTGMPLHKAYQLCPELVIRAGRHRRYGELSQVIMRILFSITPVVEPFSIDEAYLDVTQCQQFGETPEILAQRIKQRIYAFTGLKASLGMSGDKTTAKYAAKLEKPDGCTLIPPWEAAQRLAPVPVGQLCGIGPGITRFLAKHGVITCGDMQHIPCSVLRKRMGHHGWRLWLMCQGRDPDPVHARPALHKTVGHSKILPPGTRREEDIMAFFRALTIKLSGRLRKHGLYAREFLIGWRALRQDWQGDKVLLVTATQDSGTLLQECQRLLRQYWQGEGVRQIRITALDPQPYSQGDLLNRPESNQRANRVMDAVNKRFGRQTMQYAKRLEQGDIKLTANHAFNRPDVDAA